MSHQVLYRFYDKDNNLLYVGISNTWYQRFHDHERKAGWFSRVASSTFEWHSSRESVEAAELLAIRTENPEFNKANNPAYETTVDHFAKLKALTYSDLEPDDVHEKLILDMKNRLQSDKNITRKQSKWIAMTFLSSYYELGPAGEIDCRNCDAMADNKNINFWSDTAHYQLSRAYATN